MMEANTSYLRWDGSVYPFPSISLNPSLKDPTGSDHIVAQGAGDRHYETGTYKQKERFNKRDLIYFNLLQKGYTFKFKGNDA
jgi:hypothetical protein